MDVIRKPYMSQPMLSINFQASARHSTDGSSEHTSPSNEAEIEHELRKPRSSLALSSIDGRQGTIPESLGVSITAASSLPPQGPDRASEDDSSSIDGFVSVERPAVDSSSYIVAADATAGSGSGSSMRQPNHSDNNSSEAASSSSVTLVDVSSRKKTDTLQNVPKGKFNANGYPVPLDANAIRQSNTIVRSTSGRRPPVLRLATLPPLGGDDLVESPEKRMRLSPSVIVRPPPFPVLNLPAVTVPPPAARGSSHSVTDSRIPRVRLNTMPLLPREGQDEHDDDPDHEHCSLEEEEMEDDEDADDLENGGHRANGAGSPGLGSDDEDVGGEDGTDRPATPSSAARSARDARSSRPFGPSRLPSLLTPKNNFASLLAGVGLGVAGSGSSQVTSSSSSAANPGGTNFTDRGNSEAGRKLTDELSTPKPVSHKRDYFSLASSSSSSTPLAHQEKQSAREPQTPKVDPPRTPTASDYTRSQALLTPWGADLEAGPSRTTLNNSVSASTPTGPPLLPSPRPGLYHQASKSMVDLVTTARPTVIDDIRNSRVLGGVDAKGKGKGAGTDLLLFQDSHHRKDAVDKRNANANTVHSLDAQGHTKDKSTAGAGESAPSPVLGVGIPPPSTTTIRRQRSMPTFNASGPPPPYPSFLPDHLRRFKPVPRDEEGREALPLYSNDIRLLAIMPRKMEFSAPGVPAKDRKWRRVHCMLEGTAFRVYACPPSVSGVGVFGGWWEKKVGVGDVSLVNGNMGTSGGSSAAPKKEVKRAMKWEEELQAEEARQSTDVDREEGSSTASHSIEVALPGPHKSKRHLASAFLHPNRSRVSLSSNHSRTRSVSPSPTSSSFVTPRSSLQLPRPSIDRSPSRSSLNISSSSSTSTFVSSSSTIAPSSSTSSVGSQTRSHIPGHKHSLSSPQATPAQIPEPKPKDLIREYSLQNAESGLASDYYKRKNVLRVRMEGEQFLLQATDVAGVIEWIEVRNRDGLSESWLTVVV